MPRRLRAGAGGLVCHVFNRHVFNRAVGRTTLFANAAFVKVLGQAHNQVPLRLVAFWLRSSHWRLVVWPTKDGELSRYLHWLTMAPSQRWHAHQPTGGTGPLYQGCYQKIKRRAALAEKVRTQIESWQSKESSGWGDLLGGQPLFDRVSSLDGRRATPTTIAEFVALDSLYAPDINDGVPVNIAPLQKAGLLAADVLTA